ncbi:hypothetical protein VNO80_06625 [Phaseolus coccineus]|uniref:Uncharacterized protein n=1 Tax=Phaseolus coccineus TaxID=3886 RepID=A0AAN9NIB5_PHACN
MATVAESPESETHPPSHDYSKTINLQTFNETTPFIDYDSLDDLKSQYNAYEDLLFGKIKASRPLITCGAAAALGLAVLKRPRRVLYYNTLRLFSNEEVSNLTISIDLSGIKRQDLS